jgi:hypothetical protein
MSLVLRAEPADRSPRAVSPADDSLPNASPTEALLQSASSCPADDSHLAPCWHCGVLNGRSASLCWSCEADLSAVGPFRFAAAPGHADETSEGPKQPPASGGGATHGRPSVSPGDDAAVPMATAAVPAFIDAVAQFPVLTSAVEGGDPLAALSVSASMAPRRTREVVAAIVVAALAGAGAYLLLRPPALVALDATPAPGRAIRADGSATDTKFVTSTNAGAARTVPTNSIRAKAAPPAVGEASAATMKARTVEPRAQTPVQAGQLTAAPTIRPVGVAPRPKATRPATGAALTATHSGKARGTMHSANAAAAVLVPNPDRIEPARQTSVPQRPCTATVAALGLCTTPPIQSKE